MSLTRYKLSLLVLGCTCALAPIGCRSPWSGAGDSSAVDSRIPTFSRAKPVAKPAAPADEAMPVRQRGSMEVPAAADTPIEESTSQPTAGEADLDSVLEKLQEVGDLDPAAQAKLIEKLQATKPEYWPLVAEQFRASLAYHQQLVAKENSATRNNDTSASVNDPLPKAGPTAPANRSRVGGLTEPMMRRPNGAPATTDSTLPPPAVAGRPSSRIGALVDPRGVRADGTPDDLSPEETPTTIALSPREDGLNHAPREPAAPGEFTAQGATYPISSATRSEAAMPAVLPVSLDAPAAPAGPLQADDAIPSASATKPAPTDEWQKLVAKAAEDLSRHVAKSPTTTAEVHQHVSLRILRLLAGDTEKALEPIPHISPVEQDYWSRQLFALATYLDHYTQPDDKRRAAASVIHLDEAVASLHELGSLTLRNLTFCKEIYDYGAYDPYEHDRYTPGQQLLLYVEVDNFHSQSTEKGFCTSLGSTYELLSEEGTRVDSGEFPDVEDCCRSRRRDFHVQYGLTLPRTIQPGKYQLQLVIRDRGSDKIGHAKISFEVTGGKK